MKKNLILLTTSFLLVAVFETVINQLLLKEAYSALASVWRPSTELQQYAPLFLGIYLAFSITIVSLFQIANTQMDWKKGLKLGILLGIFSRFWYGYTNFIVLPIPHTLAFSWFFYGLIEVSIIGAILGGIISKLDQK
jgi:hypothetical protein